MSQDVVHFAQASAGASVRWSAAPVCDGVVEFAVGRRSVAGGEAAGTVAGADECGLDGVGVPAGVDGRGGAAVTVHFGPPVGWVGLAVVGDLAGDVGDERFEAGWR